MAIAAITGAVSMSDLRTEFVNNQVGLLLSRSPIFIVVAATSEPKLQTIIGY